MSLIIQYCEGCGERIPSDALENGEALFHGGSYYYGECCEAILSEHPELRDAYAKQKAKAMANASAGNARSSAILEAPIAPATGRRSKTSMRSRRGGSTLIAGAGSSGRRDGGGRGRNETSRRIQRQAPARQSSNSATPLLVGGAVVAVLAIVAMIALSGSGGDDPIDPTTTNGGSSSGGSAMVKVDGGDDATDAGGDGSEIPPPKVDPLKKPYEEARDDAETYPERYGDHIERLTKLQSRAEQADSALLRDIRGLRQALVIKRNESADTEFENRKRNANSKMMVGKYDEARDIWKAFPKQLLHDDIREQISEEEEAIEEARKAAEQASLLPEIPTAGEHLSMFESGVRWRTSPANRQESWKKEGETLVCQAAAQPRLIYGLKDKTSFKDYYLTFEYQGQLTLLVRLPESQGQGTAGRFNLPATTEFKRIHVLVSGTQAKFWLDGDEKSLSTANPTCTEGAVGVIPPANTAATIRGVKFTVQSFGKDFSFTPTTPPKIDPAKTTNLFDHKSLAGWKKISGQDWKVDGKDLVVSGGDSFLVCEKTPKLARAIYRVRLRAATASFSFHWNMQDDNTKADGLNFNLGRANLPPETVVEIVIVSVDKKFTVYVRQVMNDGTFRALGQPSRRDNRHPGGGKVAMKVTGEGASVRVLSVTVQRP